MKAILIRLTEKICPIPDENQPAYNAGYETKTYNTVVEVDDDDLEDDKWLFTYFDPEIHDVEVLGELPMPYAMAPELIKIAKKIIEIDRDMSTLPVGLFKILMELENIVRVATGEKIE